MSQPHRAVLPVLIQDGVLLTRLVVDPSIHITEVVSSVERLTLHMDIYSSVHTCGDNHQLPHLDGGTFVRVSGCVYCFC